MRRSSQPWVFQTIDLLQTTLLGSALCLCRIMFLLASFLHGRSISVQRCRFYTASHSDNTIELTNLFNSSLNQCFLSYLKLLFFISCRLRSSRDDHGLSQLSFCFPQMFENSLKALNFKSFLRHWAEESWGSFKKVFLNKGLLFLLFVYVWVRLRHPGTDFWECPSVFTWEVGTQRILLQKRLFG